MSTVGAWSRSFLYGLNKIETTGLDKFLQLLDERRAAEQRPRGLLTICNHVGVYGNPRSHRRQLPAYSNG